MLEQALMLSMGVDESADKEALEEEIKIVSKEEFKDQCKDYILKVLSTVTQQARLPP